VAAAVGAACYCCAAAALCAVAAPPLLLRHAPPPLLPVGAREEDGLKFDSDFGLLYLFFWDVEIVYKKC
jgi:hypothetical protein